MIPEVTVSQIKDAANIEAVVSRYVTLKKRGSLLLACCPFHNEKTPSFTVSVSKNSYKCFGCGKGGDPIEFVREIDSVSYPEALHILADMFSIVVQQREMTSEEIEEMNRVQALRIVHEAAYDLFQSQLSGSIEAVTYIDQRGLQYETIQEWEIGYTADDYKSALLGKGHSSEILVKSGLVSQNERGLYDRFRNRLVFPIRDHMNKPVGLGGRILVDDKNAAKYLNSPETEIYHKSKVLFGLNKSKGQIKNTQNCFVLEGYMDVLSFWQGGIRNTVAASGTALSEYQVTLLKRFTDTVTLIFDGDNAGEKATNSSIQEFLKQGFSVFVVILPKGEDPDSLINTHGAERTLEILDDKKVGWIEYLIEKRAHEIKADIMWAAMAMRQIIEYVTYVNSQIEAVNYLLYLAKVTGNPSLPILQDFYKMKLNQKSKKA